MNWLYRFGFKLGSDNNTCSNTGTVLVVVAIVLYWLTCSGGGKSSGSFDLVYNNRYIWGAQELCNDCSSSWSFLSTPWCIVTRWISTWGLLIAIVYWIIARRDEVVRSWEGTVERFFLDQGGTQDLPDQPAAQTPGGTPAPALAPRRPRPSGILWWASWDFISNVLSDMLTGFLYHRRS